MPFDPKNYLFTIGIHHAKNVIWVKFKYDRLLTNQLKALTKAHWSHTQRCWYVCDVKQNRTHFNMEQKHPGEHLLKNIAIINQPHFNRFIDTLQLKAYSKNTLNTYAAEFRQFLSALKLVDAETLDPARLRNYFIYCSTTLKLSENSLHSRINALKFFYEKVLHHERLFIDIPRPKKPAALPKAISKADIARIFATIKNPKHLLMLKLCYGMGLRVSEIVNLKVTDIDSRQMQVLIAKSKGKKDRYVNLPETIISPLRDYYIKYRPKEYLFEGQRGGAYTTRSIQIVFKTAIQKAQINKQAGIHSLRHSYATHLLQAGTDISFIKELLGHNNIKTTLIYTKLANEYIAKIKSPLDDIF